MSDTYRIELDQYEPGAWAEIKCRRTFGMALEAGEALGEGLKEYSLKRAELYLTDWSFDGRPNRGAFANLDENIAAAILREADTHYASHAPSEEDSKA